MALGSETARTLMQPSLRRGLETVVSATALMEEPVPTYLPGEGKRYACCVCRGPYLSMSVVYVADHACLCEISQQSRSCLNQQSIDLSICPAAI